MKRGWEGGSYSDQGCVIILERTGRLNQRWNSGQRLYADNILGREDAADWGITEVAQNWDPCEDHKSGPSRDQEWVC
jgi:hypothetical protein